MINTSNRRGHFTQKRKLNMWDGKQRPKNTKSGQTFNRMQF